MWAKNRGLTPPGTYSPLSFSLERVVGIEPTSSAWKAEVLPLNYTRLIPPAFLARGADVPNLEKPMLVEGVGFEPTKAWPADLQSAPVDRLGTPPKMQAEHFH